MNATYENGTTAVRPHKANANGVRLLALLPSIPLGGMERAALRVMQEVARHGANVHVLTNRRWGETVRREAELAGLATSDINHVATLGRPRNMLEWRTSAISLTTTTWQIDAARRRYHANALLATSANVAWFARSIARRADTVSIFRIPNPPIFDNSGIKKRLDRALWRAIGASYDHLVCNSEHAARLVARATGERGNVRVVRNYPPSLARRIVTPAPTLPPGRRRILFLGQVARHKGVEILFDAARAILPTRPDLDIVLAGPGVWLDPYPTELASRIADAGLGDRFIVIGPFEDVQGFLRQGDIHVCPSVSPGDSFPNVILDAKQAGLPSVVLPTAGLPEAIVDGVDGLVTPDHSAKALAAALAGLVDDPAQCRAMGAAARRSLERFDPARLSERWLDLLNAVADL